MIRSRKRKPMSDINVVPYIDVMLVLLVIFMVTAPLMTQGVRVDLPDAASAALDVDDEESVLVLSIKADGSWYLNIGDGETALPPAAVAQQAAKVIQANPSIQVLIEGDHELTYGAVVDAMTLLQQAGAGSVGLVTEPGELADR